jgi:phage-related minor tail protein
MGNLDGFVDATSSGDDLAKTVDGIQSRTNALGVSTTAFANVMSKAFADGVAGGKKFDDVLKSVGLRLSGLAVQQAFKPIAKDIASGLSQVFSGLFPGTPSNGSSGSSGGADAATGGVSPFFALPPATPFAAGGVIGAPTYFPLPSGGFGLAGEAGPEAIMPLSRASDGTLGVAMPGARAPASVTVQITAPDVASFKRSEAYITGQIARAVARGQRSL